jgi:hypothetical protein
MFLNSGGISVHMQLHPTEIAFNSLICMSHGVPHVNSLKTLELVGLMAFNCTIPSIKLLPLSCSSCRLLYSTCRSLVHTRGAQGTRLLPAFCRLNMLSTLFSPWRHCIPHHNNDFAECLTRSRTIMLSILMDMIRVVHCFKPPSYCILAVPSGSSPWAMSAAAGQHWNTALTRTADHREAHSNQPFVFGSPQSVPVPCTAAGVQTEMEI